jgi:hypothetical protein
MRTSEVLRLLLTPSHRQDEIRGVDLLGVLLRVCFVGMPNQGLTPDTVSKDIQAQVAVNAFRLNKQACLVM